MDVVQGKRLTFLTLGLKLQIDVHTFSYWCCCWLCGCFCYWLFFASAGGDLDVVRDDQAADILLGPCSGTATELVVSRLDSSLVLKISCEDGRIRADIQASRSSSTSQYRSW
jgi:hypothetical protein